MQAVYYSVIHLKFQREKPKYTKKIHNYEWADPKTTLH